MLYMLLWAKIKINKKPEPNNLMKQESYTLTQKNRVTKWSKVKAKIKTSRIKKTHQLKSMLTNKKHKIVKLLRERRERIHKTSHSFKSLNKTLQKLLIYQQSHKNVPNVLSTKRNITNTYCFWWCPKSIWFRQNMGSVRILRKRRN